MQTDTTLLANNSQHLHIAKSLTSFKLCATTPNNMQQGMQTPNKLVSVFTGPKTTAACPGLRGKGRAKHFKPIQQLFTANNKIQRAFQIVTNQEGESVAM